ncbi:diguanylate cyclase [Shewanella inventionis]|uniref:diguanylate cyclase n=1 Tax=Shewanella inventionis TaxID=1738770 RepID=A0ABQ1J4G3_9GAMM|nr:diguanylate cyclase [Shewanella inventionis]MCL1158964.1 diguanylate cyclase [Shewanella inventionis]UAL43064.1 diguanylate cyclase [Shewanella inventionis]GGB57193.1 GGDEF domain-containing protein [Shewanella inventionis]
MAISNLWASELEYRRTVLKAVLIVIIVAGAIFVVNNWFSGFKVYAMVELAVVCLCIGILIIHKTTPNLTLWCLVFLFALYSVILIGIYSASFNSALFTWLFIVPVLSYLLLGIKFGTLYTCVYVTGGIGILVYALIFDIAEIYPITIANIVLCLSAIWALSFSYEYKRAEAVARLQKMASLDPLTGLNNRLLLDSIFERLCDSLPEQQKSVALLLLDLDHFKRVNDQYGHDVGDKVLVEVSRILNQARRQNDWAFRLGGEEFCMLVSDTSLQQAGHIAERLRETIDQISVINGHYINLSISIGVSRWPEDGSPFSQIYKTADERLYQAKMTGRNKVVMNSDECSANSHDDVSVVGV